MSRAQYCVPKPVDVALRDYAAARSTRKRVHSGINARDAIRIIKMSIDEMDMALSLASVCHIFREKMVLSVEFGAEISRYVTAIDPMVRLARAVIVADKALAEYGGELGLL